MNWELIDMNITPDGVVLTEAGEPRIVRPRTIMLTLPTGEMIDVMAAIDRLRELDESVPNCT